MADKNELEGIWRTLADRLVADHADIAHGKMMSAEALTHGGKVFAFFSTKGGRCGLGCRLGRDYPFETLGLTDWQHLAPFRSKPPMKDWIVAGAGDAEHWNKLAGEALTIARKTEGKRK